MERTAEAKVIIKNAKSVVISNSVKHQAKLIQNSTCRFTLEIMCTNTTMRATLWCTLMGHVKIMVILTPKPGLESFLETIIFCE